MTARVSPSTQRRYPLTMICAVYRLARSSVYAATRTAAPAPTPRKPGPKTRHSDGEVVEAIGAVLAATPFHGEGYRKIRARLAHWGLRLGGKRVLRLMRLHHLLAPRRLGPPNGDPAHAGTITTTRPDEMWGTDATRFLHRGGRVVLVLRRHRSLRRRARRVAHREDRRSLGGARAAAPGRAPRVRPLREGRRARAEDPLRLGSEVHRRRLDQRGEVAGDDDHAIVRRGARVQRRDRALYAHPQGAIPLSPSLPAGASSASSSPATTPSGSSNDSVTGRRRTRA